MSPNSWAEPRGASIRARAARPDDVPALVDSHLAAVEFLSPMRGGPQVVRERSRGVAAEQIGNSFSVDLSDPTRHLLVGCIGDAVVGHAVLRCPEGASTADLLELFVDPGARGVGVGSALLAEALSEAASRSCTGIDALALPGDRGTKNFFEDHAMVARAIVVHGAVEP